MADESKMLFILDGTRPNEFFANDLFRLQHEFRERGESLSQSLLFWEEKPDRLWQLVDFQNEKTYELRLPDRIPPPLQVWSLPTKVESLLTRAGTITNLSRLESSNWTHEGGVDLLKQFPLEESDLEELKRPNLRGFSFERVHPDLLVVNEMLRGI